MTTSTFRQLVAEIAVKAKATLPQAVNGRVESAVKLVLSHDVEPQADGSILVGSSSDPLKTYVLTGQACECQDFARAQAPDGWCMHRIAAGLHKRVHQLLAATPPVPVVPEGLEPWPDNDPEEPAPPSPALPLPEAPASVNCHITIEGRQVQLTLRDSDETRLLQRLSAVLAQYPAPATPPASQGPKGQGATPQCEAHGALKKSTKGRGWYCPQKLADGTWCPSKGK